jgi:hypothetical protein
MRLVDRLVVVFLKPLAHTLCKVRVAQLAKYAKTSPDGKAKELVVSWLPGLRADLAELERSSSDAEEPRQSLVKLAWLVQQINALQRQVNALEKGGT